MSAPAHYADILAQLPRLSWYASGNGAACCPLHGGHSGDGDVNRSLSVRVGRNGALILKCHAKHGCTFDKIAASLGREMTEFFPPSDNSRKRPEDEVESCFEYLDQHGEIKYRAVRTKQKRFWLERYDAENDCWPAGLGGFVQPIPFHLPELYGADPDRVVWVAEGEKKVLALERLGLVATCNAAGSEKWLVEWGQHFKGRPIAILPDHDEAGFKHAGLVASCLQPFAGPIRVVELPGLKLKEDVVDWLLRWPDADAARSALADIYANSPFYDGSDVQYRNACLRLHMARALVASCYT